MFNLFTDETLNGRIQMALAVTAGYVLAEPAATPNHLARARLASFSLNVPAEVARQFLPAFVADPGVRAAATQEDITDGTIDAVIAANYDGVATRI